MRIGNNSMQSSNTSMGADFELAPVWLGHIANFSLQLVFTGTPDGSFKLQASSDLGKPDGGQISPLSSGVVNWTDIAGSAQSVSGAGDIMWQVQNAGYSWVRVVWTWSSSTGTVTSARYNVKGV